MIDAPDTAVGRADRLRARWLALAPRERRWAVGAALLVVVALVWLVAVQPALRTVRQAPPQLDALDTSLAQMQRLAAESRALGAAAPVLPAQAGRALQAATDRLGMKAKLALQGDRATLTLTGVPGDAVRGWLADARSTAHARAIDVQLTRTTQGFAGNIVVVLGAAP